MEITVPIYTHLRITSWRPVYRLPSVSSQRNQVSWAFLPWRIRYSSWKISSMNFLRLPDCNRKHKRTLFSNFPVIFLKLEKKFSEVAALNLTGRRRWRSSNHSMSLRWRFTCVLRAGPRFRRSYHNVLSRPVWTRHLIDVRCVRFGASILRRRWRFATVGW